MIGFIARLVMMVFFIGGVGFIIYQIAAFLLGVQPTKAALKRDLKSIRKILDHWANELIPWDIKDLKLISRDRSVNVSRSGLNKIVSGIVQSIYYESMIAYAYKTFSRGDQVGLMVIRSLDNEFVYQYSDSGVEVFMDNHHIGKIGPDNKLRAVQSSDVLARIQDGLQLKPVFVGEREVAVIKESMLDEDHADRYFEYVDILTDKESPLVLALTLYELVMSEGATT